jgi:recombinational DNA repair ATPase RecF
VCGSVQSPNIAVTSLSIRDFRGIAALDLDFMGPDGHPNSLVVLAGPNGCGKTAVLEAALLLVGGSELLVGRKDEFAIRRGPRIIQFRRRSKTELRDSPTDTNLQGRSFNYPRQ